MKGQKNRDMVTKMQHTLVHLAHAQNSGYQALIPPWNEARMVFKGNASKYTTQE